MNDQASVVALAEMSSKETTTAYRKSLKEAQEPNRVSVQNTAQT